MLIHRFVLVAVAALSTVGCGGPSIGDICSKVAACEGSDVAECQSEGEQLERAAVNAGCGDAFDDWVECLDSTFQCVDGDTETSEACQELIEDCEADDNASPPEEGSGGTG